MDDVIKYWEQGAEEKGLMVPLKQWRTLFKTEEYRSEAMKLSMISTVYDEFSVHCEGSWETFEAEYGGLRKHYTKLAKKIRANRIARGEAKGRPKRATS